QREWPAVITPARHRARVDTRLSREGIHAARLVNTSLTVQTSLRFTMSPMNSHRQPGPADLVYTTASLATIAFAQAAANIAEQAAALVNVPIHKSLIKHAEDLLGQCRQLIDLAAIHDYEHHQSRYLNQPPVTPDDPTYGSAIRQWINHIERPWTGQGQHITSTLPQGLDNPTQTARRLDGWLRAPRAAQPVYSETVSQHLKRHTQETETLSFQRHEEYLTQHQGTPEELAAHHARLRRLNQQTHLSPPEFLSKENLPETGDIHTTQRFWPEIMHSVQKRHPLSAKLLSGTQCIHATDETIIIGHHNTDAARLLNVLEHTFIEATTEITGITSIRVQVLHPKDVPATDQ
ncbi:hypothetical protein QRB41_28255, partial [Mycobacterium avium subsp. hominissuis]|uniref:hypothetical protein n=1 Tax=Mycobacterium avium TaxID=1764 RepID=UPI002666ED3E